MEDTQELTSDRVDKPASGSQDRSTESSIFELPRFLLNPRAEFKQLAAAVLEWSLELLGFERGFLLLEKAEAAEVSSANDDGFSVLVSRRKGGGDWREVINPEFALNRSVVRRALSSTEPVAVDDCLIRGANDVPAEHADQHRAVLCQSFALAGDTRGAIYLDRAMGMDSIDPGEKETIAALTENSAPSLGRALQSRELERLRKLVQELEESPSTGVDAEREDGDEEISAGIDSSDVFHGIVGRDEKLEKIYHIIKKVKNSNLNVCIFGESGTGKELVACAIHEASNRGERDFVPENCGAITESLLESELFGHVKGSFTGADENRKGLFELAHEGTLFLDEIGDMSEGMQRKLLRALQEGTIRPIGSKNQIKVDVRVICASHRDLKHLVREGSFRADLYYRLNVIQIQVPPLRERKGDLRLLIDHFTSESAREEGTKKRFGDSAIKALCQYSWPGNVRELRNVIRRALLTCPRRVVACKDVLPYLTNFQATACLGENIERDENHLLLRIPLRKEFNDIVDECERLVLLNALKENNWNKSRVTKALGIPRQSLYNKIAKYQLQKEWSKD